MATEQTTWGSGANAEAIAAWDGPLFERFVRFRHIVTTGLGNHGDEALRRYPPRAGERVLDIGCGFGDTTQQIAELVGPDGEAVGVDAAPRFIEAADRRGAAARTRASWSPTSSGSCPPSGRFDRAFSRFGTMFFANPVAALRNVRAALVPGGELTMVVWRQRIDNEWLYRGAADRRAVRQPARRVRRADLRARPVLDGRRRHDERRPAARRLHRHRLPSLRPPDPDRP